jgi:hypothetical protein
MTTRLRMALILLCGVVAAPAPVRADVTAFLGISPTPGLHLGRGAAVGAGFIVVAFEVEAAQILEQTTDGEPALSTGMGNILVQTPLEVSRMQFYGTAGAGLYRERLGTVQETNGAVNIGGGVKIGLAGPLKLRLDYRLFRLRGAPLHPSWHRVYAGATLGF